MVNYFRYLSADGVSVGAACDAGRDTRHARLLAKNNEVIALKASGVSLLPPRFAVVTRPAVWSGWHVSARQHVSALRQPTPGRSAQPDQRQAPRKLISSPPDSGFSARTQKFIITSSLILTASFSEG